MEVTWGFCFDLHSAVDQLLDLLLSYTLKLVKSSPDGRTTPLETRELHLIKFETLHRPTVRVIASRDAVLAGATPWRAAGYLEVRGHRQRDGWRPFDSGHLA
jgi:hypothetical protein